MLVINMKNIHINIITTIILIILLTFIISCGNVKKNQFTAGKIAEDAITKTIDTDNETSEDIITYISLPDWQHYDLNPSSSYYKEIYGISKFKDKRIVLAFQQVP